MMRAAVFAGLACLTAATDPKIDTDLGYILDDDKDFKNIEYFWVRDNKKSEQYKGGALTDEKRFEKLLELVKRYSDKILANHLSTGFKVDVLQKLIAYRNSAAGKELYEKSLKVIRESPLTNDVPKKFNRCASYTSAEAGNEQTNDATGADKDKSCKVSNDAKMKMAYTVPEVNAMAEEVVYTVFLKHALAQHAIDAKLLENCKAPIDSNAASRTTSTAGALSFFDDNDEPASYESLVIAAAAKASAKTVCSHKQKAVNAAKVVKSVSEATEMDLSKLNLAFIKANPKDIDVLGNPKAWETKHCAGAALKWFIGKLVDTESGDCATPVLPPVVDLIPTDNVPPTLEDVLALQAYDSIGTQEFGAPWMTVLVGGSVGGFITIAAYSYFTKRVGMAEE